MKKSVLIAIIVAVVVVVAGVIGVLFVIDSNPDPGNGTHEHIIVLVDPVEPTCYSVGYGESYKCSECGAFLREPEEIPMIPHEEGDWIVDKEATKLEDGKKHTECTMCANVISEDIIPALGSVGLEYTVNSDDATCTVKGIGTCTDSHVFIPRYIDGYKVTAIATRAFYSCTTITEVTIPDTVTNIGTQIFYKASNLHTVYCNAEYWGDYLNLEHITKVVLGGSGKFQDHKYLKEVEIKDSVTSVGGFAGCTSLESIVIPNSVKIIGDEAFFGCTSLERIEFNGTLGDWLSISFSSKDSNPVYVGADVYINGEIINNAQSVSIPDGIKEIGSYLFLGWDSLKTVVIPDSVETIKPLSFSDTTIESIEIPDSVKEMGYGTFYNCTSLESIVIPVSITSIGESAFNGCSSLQNVVIPDSVTSIGECTFYGCASLESIVIPVSITSIGESAFNGCSSLQNVVIPDSVTSIGEYAFYDCTSIESIVIPDSVTSISAHTFDGCTSLESIVISDSVTSIGEYAFHGCTSLESIVIPDSVDRIYKEAFLGCSSLESVVFENPKWWILGQTEHIYEEMDYSTDIMRPVSSLDLSDKAIAAELIKEKYSSRYWYRDPEPTLEESWTLEEFKAYAEELADRLGENAGFGRVALDVAILEHGRELTEAQKQILYEIIE